MERDSRRGREGGKIFHIPQTTLKVKVTYPPVASKMYTLCAPCVMVNVACVVNDELVIPSMEYLYGEPEPYTTAVA